MTDDKPSNKSGQQAGSPGESNPAQATSSGSRSGGAASGAAAGGPTPNRDKPRSAPVIEAKPGDVREIKSEMTAGPQAGPAPAKPDEKAPDQKPPGQKTPDNNKPAQAAKAGDPAKPPFAADSPPPAMAQASRGGFGSMTLAGLIGAAIALLGAWGYQSFSGSGNVSVLAALTDRTKAGEAAISAQKKALDGLKSAQESAAADLKKRVAGVEAGLKQQAGIAAALKSDIDRLTVRKPPQVLDLAPVIARVAALEKLTREAKSSVRATQNPDAKIQSAAPTPNVQALIAQTQKGLAPEFAKVLARVTALEGKVKPPADLSPVNQRIASLEKKVDPIGKRLAPLDEELARNKQSAAANAKAISEAGKKLSSSIKKSNAAAVAILARTLFERVSAGQPYDQLLSAAAALGAGKKQLDTLRPNATSGVKSRETLQRAFAALEDKLLQTEKPKADAPILDRLKHGAFSLVKVRPVGKTAGSDPAAVVARIQAALRGGDLSSGLALFGKLPQAAQNRAQPFVADLKSRIAAEAAAVSILSEALAQLQPDKS